jgi:N-acyl homoserine lactone hydrolase
MAVWTIKPLCFGEFPVFEKSVFTYLRHFGEKVRAPIFGWLLQSGPEAILVDTGPSSPEMAQGWHTPIQQTPAQRPDAAVRLAGADPARLTRVVLTHLHWDHCYNLEMFPSARFWLQADELEAARHPLPSQRLPYEVGIPDRQPPWQAAVDRLEVIRGRRDVAPGVTTIPLPGHTPGLQGVLVDTAGGKYLIASDALPLLENLGSAGVDPIAPAIHIDVAACFDSLARMRTVADVVLPSHDPEVLKHPIYPE